MSPRVFDFVTQERQRQNELASWCHCPHKVSVLFGIPDSHDVLWSVLTIHESQLVGAQIESSSPLRVGMAKIDFVR